MEEMNLQELQKRVKKEFDRLRCLPEWWLKEAVLIARRAIYNVTQGMNFGYDSKIATIRGRRLAWLDVAGTYEYTIIYYGPRSCVSSLSLRPNSSPSIKLPAASLQRLWKMPSRTAPAPSSRELGLSLFQCETFNRTNHSRRRTCRPLDGRPTPTQPEANHAHLQGGPSPILVGDSP
jgi:hypothetical protein